MENEEEVDPVIQAIERTGCLELHNAVQECMFEHKDWRKCQQVVNTFRSCVQEHHNKKKSITTESTSTNEQCHENKTLK